MPWRYRVCQTAGYLALGVCGAAMAAWAVLIAVGVVPLNGAGPVGRLIGCLLLLLIGVLCAEGVVGGIGQVGKVRTERQLDWRPPRSRQEWGDLVFFVAVVLVGAGVAVVGLLGGFHFTDSSGSSVDVSPFAFWVAGGLVATGGMAGMLLDEWRDEVRAMSSGRAVSSGEEESGDIEAFMDE